MCRLLETDWYLSSYDQPHRVIWPNKSSVPLDILFIDPKVTTRWMDADTQYTADEGAPAMEELVEAELVTFVVKIPNSNTWVLLFISLGVKPNSRKCFVFNPLFSEFLPKVEALVKGVFGKTIKFKFFYPPVSLSCPRLTCTTSLPLSF